uniref:sp110 nuclear body protein isoform X2 n=1 Tax=Callithrix jacchus TaxID=9483 RepID=UPI0023DD3D84|nr:sp110 nuclear body protein isoform X2 [Callithrix jacchus]
MYRIRVSHGKITAGREAVGRWVPSSHCCRGWTPMPPPPIPRSLGRSQLATCPPPNPNCQDTLRASQVSLRRWREAAGTDLPSASCLANSKQFHFSFLRRLAPYCVYQSTDFLFCLLASPRKSPSLSGVIPGPVPGTWKRAGTTSPASRMFTMTRAMEEALFQHFMYQKLRIAYAIHKPFPFFEGLLDNSFITQRMYMESLEACRNLVPVSKVVHNVLTQLERTFNLSLLVTLFSPINLHEYPNLVTIYRSFKRVGEQQSRASCEQQSRGTPILLEAPTDLAGGSSLPTLLPLPPPQTPQPSCSSCAPRVREPGTSSQQSDEILSESPSPSDRTLPLPGLIQEGRNSPVTSDKLTPKMNEEEDSKEMPSLLASTVQVASDNLIPQIKDNEGLQEMPRSPSGPMPEIRDDSLEPNDSEEPQEVSSTPSKKKGKKSKRCIWSTPKKRQKKKNLPRGTASPRHGIKKKLKVVDRVPQKKDDSTWKSTVMTRAQKARTQHAPKSRSEEISDGTSKLNEGKRYQETPSTPSRVKQEKRRKEYGLSSSKRKQNKKLPRENLKSDTVDFHWSELPVTCGEAKGILYKAKMKHGSSTKCIQNENGAWLTPKEFEIEGKGRDTKNWKRSIRCRGKPLLELLKWKNSDQCEVCCKGGQLLCCGTCPRAFHEDCHIPPVEAKRTPWSCTFCRMKRSSGSQQCHRVSKILERRMQPQEQLKCEFLLLKAYCHPQSSFFTAIPLNIRDYGEPFQEAMWLDLIKERLITEMYTVAWFVRDVRLIFRNHKTFYKASDFGQVGLDLEAEFEKDVKDVFGFHEANDSSFRTPP